MLVVTIAADDGGLSRRSSSTTMRRSVCSSGSTSSSKASPSARRRHSPRPRRRSSASGPTSSCSTSTSAARTAAACSSRLRSDGIPVAVVTGSVDIDGLRRLGRRCAGEAVRARHPRRDGPPAGYGCAHEHDRSILSADRVRVAARRNTCSSAPRSGAPSASARRRSSEQAEIVRRYADLFSREQLDALREAEEARGGDDARAPVPAAQDVRRRSCLGRARRARGRAREPAARRRASRSRARRCRCGTPRRSSPCCPRTPTARSSGEIQAEASAAVQPRPPRADAGRRGARRRVLRDRRRDRAQRGGEGDLAARALEGAQGGERRRHRELRPAARALVRAAARRRARRRAVELPHRLHAPALAARGDLHEGSRDGDLPADPRGARLRPVGAAEHQARSRRPAAEVAARLRDRERSAEGRPPDHARPGRPARLSGVPARGRPRAALRRLRSRRCRTSSAASRATTR